MTRARLAARAGLLGMALAVASTFAAAAPAHADPMIQIDSPETAATITDSSTVTVAGRVEADIFATITGVSYEIVRGGTRFATGSSGGPDYSFSANLPLNGPYTLVVTATQASIVGSEAFTARRDFAMAVRPSPPTGLIAGYADGRVQLAWTGPGHADLRGYAVYRSGSAAAPQLIGATLAGVTTYADASPPAGATQYWVAALRNGAVITDVAEQWLVSPLSAPAPVTVPGPPAVGVTTTTAPATGGSAQTGDASNISLSDVFPSSPTPTLPPIQVSPTPTLPDTGFGQTLPFEEGTEEGKVGGRAPGRPASASASGELTAGDSAGSSTNRRALLVPVAAGSVLCVAALHLRWLNRRLAMPIGGGGEGLAAGDLEPTDVDADPLGDERLPVGAGK